MALSIDEFNEAANTGNSSRCVELLKSWTKDAQRQLLNESLLRATYEGRADAVDALLKARASPAATDSLGHTALHWAARQGHEALGRLLLERKADPAAKNQDGVTPLHMATTQNFGPMIQLLIAFKADPACTTSDKRTSLHLAAEHGCAVAGALLLEIGADSEAGAARDSAALALLECETERGETALARAAAKDHATLVQLLMRARANPEHPNSWGQVALHLSAYFGNVAATAVLLENRADIQASAQDGSTPLHAAAERNSNQVIELLMSKGADASAKAVGGHAALHSAAQKGCPEAALALLANGADPEPLTDEDRTPFSYAVERGHVPVAKILLEHKANIQACDNVHQTPLHAAAAAGRAEACDFLIDKRAKLNAEDNAGRTPIVLALLAQQDSAVRLLLKRGALLPEEAVQAPELQPMIKEVENEVLQEYLAEAEANRSPQDLEDAEQEFEEARTTMLKVTIANTAANSVPILRRAEAQYTDSVDAREALDKVLAALQPQVTSMRENVEKATAEAESKQAELDVAKQRKSGLETLRRSRAEDVVRWEKQMKEDAASTKANEDLEAEIHIKGKGILEQCQALSEELAKLNEENEVLQKEIDEGRHRLDQWNQNKTEVAALHARAQALILRKATEEAPSAEPPTTEEAQASE